LAGRYHELVAGDKKKLPSWAWINPLAHAERAELERLASVPCRRGDPLGFVSFLAGELLRRADRDGETLERIQRARLVPLELVLLDGVDPGPIGLAGLAEAARVRIEPDPPPRSRPDIRS
jgi:hypothetical protein